MMNTLMKKIAVAVTVAAMTITTAVVPAFANVTEYCTASNLSVRTSPSANAEEVGSYEYGQDVDVIESVEGTNWVKVNYDGYQRYVNADYLSLQQPSDSEYSWLKTHYNVATKGDYTVCVDSGYLALRTSPSFDDANEIAALYNGTEVELVNGGEGTYWCVYVPSTGQTGYVNSNYLY